jgi:hypothetical protein
MSKLDRLPLPTDCIPRFIKLEEEEAITNWLVEHLDYDHSFACTVVDTGYVSVYENPKMKLPRYSGTIIVLLQANDVLMFSWKDKELKLLKEYKSS